MHQFNLFTVSLVIGLLIFITGCDTRAPTLDQVRQTKQGDYPLRTQHLSADGIPLFTNRLIREHSPYLLQHAHNPVDWWAWSEEAFATAKKQDKPILLSIGYSTCHWCHVMERESFESLEIAEFINQHFIAIKVDREEHPDIDETYLTAVQMLSGKVGWPLTAVLTPSAEPFFGGTYFAPEQFLSLLNKISQTWIDNRPAIQEQAARLKLEMSKLSQAALISKTIDTAALSAAESQIARDLFAPPKYNQPGFPREPEMLFLLQRAILNADASMLDSLRKRLLSIANGGIHDQVGGGFHRYSVDSEWRIPHFEKMLYNQAQLGQLYALAYQYTGDARLKSVSDDTFNYMMTELANDQRGFYAAMDAESDRTEGGFYIWSYAELTALLTDEELAIAEQSLKVSRSGNFNSANVLQRAADLSIEDLAATQTILQKLLRARQSRTPPNTDRKVITAWNGMAISALIAGFHASDNSDYKNSALTTAQHLWDTAYSKDTGLIRNSNAQDNPIPAALDDYAFLINAFIDLYDHLGDPLWLARAEKLTQRMQQDFYDPITGGFFISNKNINKDLVVSLVVARDDALYSGNSAAAQSLARLYKRTGNLEYRTLTHGLIAHFSSKIVRSPMSTSGLWLAASILNANEIGATHFAARGRVKVRSTLNKDRLAVAIEIEPGWHINAHQVLSDYLIPTKFTNFSEQCPAISSVNYPAGQRVTLGFQSEPLIVYENTVNFEAVINSNLANCSLTGVQLKLQACSDEVCLEPESIPLRFPGT